MHVSAKEDVGTDAATVFAMLTDFPAFERAALRRGAEVARLDRLETKGVGMSWSGSFAWRGRQRRFVADLTRFDPAAALGWTIDGGGFRAAVDLTLIALSPKRTRILARVEIKPRTIAARIRLQALRLQRQRLVGRVQKGLRDVAMRIERGHQAGAR
jgi:hypothetical protein